MTRLIAGFLGAFVLCTSAAAQDGNSNVNVNVNSDLFFADAYTEVILNGAGGGTVNFLDLLTAPTSAADAVALALADLGLAPDQALSDLIVAVSGADSLVETIFSSNYNPIDNPDLVIGDPNDYSTWIAVGDEDVLVNVDLFTTEYTLYSVSANVVAVTPVPLPASGLVLLAALGGAGAFLRRKAA